MSHKYPFVWIDLEMTGLDPDRNVILEIASIVTDEQLTVIEKGPSLVIHQSDEQLNRMDEWVAQLHAASGLTDLVKESSVSVQQAELLTLAFIKKFCKADEALLCGNSVWQDKAFLRRYMPSIIDYLHYRIIDVTSIKELVTRWYPDRVDTLVTKKETHRAQEDIEESIAELKHYKKHFFV